jgi:hypothetical protein
MMELIRFEAGPNTVKRLLNLTETQRKVSE